MKVQYMNLLKLTTIISVVTLIPLSGLAAQSRFDLERERDIVCKTSYLNDEKNETTRKCYKIAEEFSNRIEIVDKVRAFLEFQALDSQPMSIEQFQKIGGAFVLKKDALKDISQNYRRISLRNFALDLEAVEEKEGQQLIPFFADIYWQGRAYMEGTLHTEGFIVVPKGEVNLSLELNDSANALPTAQFNGYSDSSTELRSLETSARYIHFRTVNGMNTDVNQDTLDFLNNSVGPVMVGEIFYVPIYSSLFESMSEVISDAIAKGLREMAGEIINGISESVRDPDEQGSKGDSPSHLP